MKNTYIPLSIAFIGADGRILNIEDMASWTENTHPSHGIALYVIEMKRGFAERGIGAGDAVNGIEKAPKAAETQMVARCGARRPDLRCRSQRKTVRCRR